LGFSYYLLFNDGMPLHTLSGRTKVKSKWFRIFKLAIMIEKKNTPYIISF